MSVDRSSETVHATCVAIGGRGVLIAGRSGRGKSDLALRLIDRGAVLVSDDYTLAAARRRARCSPRRPPTIAGQDRGARRRHRRAAVSAATCPVALLVDLDATPERLPEPGRRDDRRRRRAGDRPQRP